MMHSMTTTVDVEEALRCVGRMNDDAIDLAEAALMLAAFDRPDAPVDNYRDHLSRDRTRLDKPCKRLALPVVELGGPARRLAVNQPIRPPGIET